MGERDQVVVHSTALFVTKIRELLIELVSFLGIKITKYLLASRQLLSTYSAEPQADHGTGTTQRRYKLVTNQINPLEQ